MKRVGICLTGIMILASVNCATYKTSLYDWETLSTVSAWYIDFSYATGELERKVTSDGKNETKIIDRGQLTTDLQLKQDLFYVLKDRYLINVVKDKNLASGFIKILPIHFEFGGFRSLDVALFDTKENLLARIKVINGDRNATLKSDDSFAEYSAEAISKLIPAKK